MPVGTRLRNPRWYSFQMLCSTALVCSVAIAALASLRWPLVGDSSLMHYVIFLQRQGLTPYKDIVDINLPGTYAMEALAMRCFGDGALAWRLYDLSLLGALGLAAAKIAGRGGWFAGLFSGSVFALVHLQDGLEQSGQRNLLMAVLLLWSYVALFRAQRSSERLAMTFLAGVAWGSMAAIKPTMLPLALALLGLTSWDAYRKGMASSETLFAGVFGLILPAAAALIWLKTTGALPAFLNMCGELLTLHAQLGRQTIPFLMSHCLSPISWLAGLWLLISLIEKPLFSLERVELLLGLLGTVLAYIAEGKGYPYQRYPFLAILLVVIGIDLSRALSHKGIARNSAVCVLSLTCFVLVPRYAWLTHSFDDRTPFQSALSADLLKLGGPSELSGNIQCLDTFGGCIITLYNLQLRQSTGFLYDCYLFSGNSDANEHYRKAFWSSFQAHRPAIVVETNQFCFGDARGFGKLVMWPRLNQVINDYYELRTAWKSTVLQHWWKRKEPPTEFRIYLLKMSAK